MFKMLSVYKLEGKNGVHSFEGAEEKYKWIATDEDGDVYGFNFEPNTSDDIDFIDYGMWVCGIPSSDEDDGDFIASIAYSGDWKDSLRKSKRGEK